jgi:Family of unknown function (DUF6339)
MTLQFLKRAAVAALEKQIIANLNAYRSGQTAELVVEANKSESSVEVTPPPSLIKADGELESDAAATRLVYQWLANLNPTQASDGRLWSLLTHTVFADYVQRRWGSSLEDSKEPEVRVLERWFFRGEGSSTFVRNGLSRLWWFGHITYDRDRGDPFELTDTLLSLQDIQVAFLERSLGRCRLLLKVVLETLRNYSGRPEFSTGRGEAVQRWARELNKLGGAYILDALPPDRLRFVVEHQLKAAASS